MSLINQYSFLWIAVILIAIAAFFLLRNRPGQKNYLLVGVAVTFLIVAWVILRPIQTPRMDTAAQVQAQIGQGTPVLLEFQSPY